MPNLFRSPRSRPGIILLAGTTALCGGIGSACAQTAQPFQIALGGVVNAPQIEEVTVTARHRKEKAQSVPIALTSIPATQLSNTGTVSVTQLGKLAPALQVTETNPRNTSFNIRGIGNNVSVTSDGLESGVGVYVDNVLYGRPGAATFALPDLQDVQILRGPQGTLFGKNTTSGAIDVHTLAPSFTYGADAEASIGNDGYWQFKGGATGPINDQLALRISVLGDQRNGTITDTVSRQHFENLDDKSVRIQLLYKPIEDLTIRVIADYSHQRENCCVGTNAGVLTTLTTGVPLFGIAQRGALFGYTLPASNAFSYNTDINNNTRFQMETGGGSVQADYNLNGYTITSISAWRFWNWDPFNDVDGTPIDAIEASQTDQQKQASQELRLTSPLGGAVDYTAGLYYFYQTVPGQLRTAYGTQAGPFVLTPSIPPALGSEILNNLTVAAHTAADTASYAGYGQATWHVIPALDLTGGLRYTYEDKSGSYDQFQYGGEALSDIPAALRPTVIAVRNSLGRPLYYDQHTHNGAVSWLLTATYKISPDAIAYATYSRGNKSGGINVSNLPVGINPSVKPERVDNYEVGAKTQFWHNRLTLNAAAYWIEDSDYQATVTAPLAAGTFTSYIANVPKIRSRGLELDATTARFHGLQLRWAGAFDDAVNESFPAGPCPVEQVGAATKSCNLTGKEVPGTSRWTMSTGGEYEHTLGEVGAYDLTGYLGADFTLRSSFNDTVNDSVYGNIPGYGLLDVRAGVRTDDSRYDFFVWSRNATGTKYYQTLSVSGSTGIISGLVGDPTMFGATLRAHF